MYRENRFEGGSYARVSVYPVRRRAVGARGKRNQPSRPAQERQNELYRINRINDLIDLNFSDGDFLLHLKYDSAAVGARGDAQRRGGMADIGDVPETKQAKAMLSAYIRRLRRAVARAGGDPNGVKYLAGTYSGKKSGRVHHHMYLHVPDGTVSMGDIVRTWEYGTVSVSPLVFDEADGVRGSCIYIARQMRANPDGHFYSYSRNLVKPHKDGADRNIFQTDYHLRERDIQHLIEHQDDYGYVARLYPGWACAGITVSHMKDPETGEEIPNPFGIFMTFRLYRPRARDRFGRKLKAKEGAV